MLAGVALWQCWSVDRQLLWIMMKFGTDIHVPLWMNCNNFGDPLMFPLAPSSG